LETLRLVSNILLFSLLIPATAMSQEGFPLEGTWRGEWGVPGGEQTMAVIVMNWDGEQISGRINPGRNMIFFEEASLDAKNWIVRFSSISKEGQPITFEGVLEDIGSYNRTISGTWTIAGLDNELVLTRE